MKNNTNQHPPNLIQRPIQKLFPNRIMPPRIIISRILLPTNQQLRMKQTPEIPRPDLINRARIEVHKDRPRHEFSGAGFGEDCFEFARFVDGGRVGVGLAVGEETVFEEVSKRGQLVSGK